MNDIPDDLQGDPRRRASDAARGFLYQFWRTVEAWIALAPEDVLFVEGAEDFDRVGEREGTAVQVKDDRASGPLTLGNVRALKALANFLELTKANRGRRIRFKFITTAAAGSERNGFAEEKGIELWNQCARSRFGAHSADVTRIRDFLLARSVASALQQFLKNASAEAVHQELIEPFEWVYDQPGLTDIREIIIGRLLEVGGQRGLTTRDAARLADELCMNVFDAATKQTPQKLTLPDFMQHLDRALNIEIPRGALRRQEQAFDALLTQRLASREGEELPAVAETTEAFLAPVLSSRVWPRRSLIDRVRSALEAGIAWIDGSAGMGKTTLVRQAVNGREPLLWAGLRERTPQVIAGCCRRLVRHIAAGAEAPAVVLDDFNVEGDLRVLEEPLGRLRATVAARRGALIVVSYRSAGPRIASKIGLPSASQISVPAFEEQEIEQFMMAEGCPDQRAGQLSRVVWLQTSGHPQLVAARIDALKASGFPSATFEDIVDQPKEIRDTRAEALQVVRSALPEAARDMLYRLSVSFTTLKRSHALRIGAAAPAIPRAGEVFDQLVGPWLEQPEPGRYRVSALISKAGDALLTRDEVRQVHEHIATALLAERRLTVSEFSGLVSHAVLGRAEFQLVLTARTFLTAPPKIKESLAEAVSWVARVRIDEGSPVQLTNKAVRQFFRLFQWDVARLTGSRELELLAHAMEADFPADAADLVDVLPRIMYLSKLLLEVDFPIPAERVVSHTLEVWRLMELANREGVGIAAGMSPMYPGADRSAFSDLLTVALIPRVRRVEDLRSLISGIDALGAEDRGRVLSGFLTDDGDLRVLFNGPWVSMRRPPASEYSEYAQALADALSAGRRWQHRPWIRASARALSAILDEMLDRPVEARRVVMEALEEAGPSPSLEDQIAAIAFNRKEYDAALAIWERVLPGWDADRRLHDMQPVFSTRCAAIAAAHLGRWDVAAALFGRAVERSATLGMRPWSVGLKGDRGYALWRNGNRREAVSSFREAVEALEKLPNTPESFAEYAVQKLVGHVLATLAIPDASMTPPVPGMCSQLDPHEGIKELPPTPTIYAWFLIARLAGEAGDDAVAAWCMAKIRNAPFAFLRAMAARAALLRCLRSTDLERSVTLAINTALEMERSMKRQDLPPHEPDPPSLTATLTEGTMTAYVRPALWASIVQATRLGVRVADLVAVWQSQADPAAAEVSAELQLCETRSRMEVGELSAILKSGTESREKRVLAAVLLLSHEDSLVENMLYAQVTVFDTARDSEILREASGDSFDAVVRRGWLRFCDRPFVLRAPQLYVGAIREACQTSVVGWSTAAKIILAAAPATRLNIPEGMRRRLLETANRANGC